jgi:hypothetical protein
MRIHARACLAWRFRAAVVPHPPNSVLFVSPASAVAAGVEGRALDVPARVGVRARAESAFARAAAPGRVARVA